MKILYPADYFEPSKPDQEFAPEAAAFRDAGFEVFAIDVEGTASRPSRWPDLGGDRVLYRGWMLDSETYGRTAAAIRKAGGEPFTSVDDYLLTHHIPNWAPLLDGLTPETVVLPNGADFERELRALGWDEFFVKDYVKSLKTSMGSKISDPSMIGTLVEEMRNFRGTVEGGLCVRRVEDLEPETERRFFVLRGTPHAAEGRAVPEIVSTCAERIDSPFFSVDVARRTNGELRIVEVGDGQVSDLVGWEIDRFVGLFATDS